VALINYVGLNTLDRLIDGEADMAIVPRAVEFGANQSLLLREPFAERSWALFLSADHPQLGKRRITPADLVRYPLIVPEQGSEWRRRVDDVFRAAGMVDRMRVSLEVSIPFAARRYASLGLGIAIFPKPKRGVEFSNLSARPLGDLLPAEPIVILWRRGVTPRQQARLFADYARQRLQSDDVTNNS
jgi:DNA-binding transcriptional LysR family regulator